MGPVNEPYHHLILTREPKLTSSRPAAMSQALVPPATSHSLSASLNFNPCTSQLKTLKIRSINTSLKSTTNAIANLSRAGRWSLNGMTALVTGGTRGIGYFYLKDSFGCSSISLLTLNRLPSPIKM